MVDTYVMMERCAGWPAFESSFVGSNPKFSNRLRLSRSTSSPEGLGSSRALTASAIFVTHSQTNQSSHAFRPIPLRRIISPSTSVIKVGRQAFSRSSEGKRTASTPCTNSVQYAASFCCCSMTVAATSGSGIGLNAGCGHNIW